MLDLDHESKKLVDAARREMPQLAVVMERARRLCRRRSTAIVTAMAVLVAIASFAAVRLTARPDTRVHVGGTTRPETPTSAAHAAATNLAGRLKLPSSARRSATVIPRLSQIRNGPRCSAEIDIAAFWTAPGSPSAFMRTVQQHPPRGLTDEGMGVATSGVGVQQLYNLVFFTYGEQWGKTALYVTSDSLNASIVGIRVDATAVPSTARCLFAG
jgi:hypothetical protein